MRYVEAKRREAFKVEAYRFYVTDCLRSLIGKEENPRYCDIIESALETKKAPTYTKEDVIERIKNKLKGD